MKVCDLFVASTKTREDLWYSPNLWVSIKEIDRSANRLIFAVHLCDGRSLRRYANDVGLTTVVVVDILALGR